MPADPPPEIAAFLSFLAARGLDHCILHASPDLGPLSGGGDLDVYVEPAARRQAASFLLREGWREDHAHRFRRRRRYYSVVRGGRKSKVDLSTVYAVYGRDTYWALRGRVERQTGPDGHPYLSLALGAAFAAKKARVKAGAASPGVSEPEVDGLFHAPRSGGWSVWGWVRARAKWARPASGALTVALVGLDGAGKGTQADLLDEALTKRGFHVGRRYLGYSSFLLPPLRWVIAVRDRSPPGPLRGLWQVAYLALLPLDFLLRRGIGFYDVLVTDRHPLYEPVFPHRAASAYDGLLAALCPRPDLVVHLAGDAEALWRRKPEIDLAAVRAKARILESLVERRAARASTVTVDATEPVQTVARRILAAVEARLG